MGLDGANILKDLNRLEERDSTFAFKVQSTPDEDVVKLLWDKYGIALRTENYCLRAPEGIGCPHYDTGQLDSLQHSGRSSNIVESIK